MHYILNNSTKTKIFQLIHSHAPLLRVAVISSQNKNEVKPNLLVLVEQRLFTEMARSSVTTSGNLRWSYVWWPTYEGGERGSWKCSNMWSTQYLNDPRWLVKLTHFINYVDTRGVRLSHVLNKGISSESLRDCPCPDIILSIGGNCGELGQGVQNPPVIHGQALMNLFGCSRWRRAGFWKLKFVSQPLMSIFAVKSSWQSIERRGIILLVARTKFI